ncbi:heme peroxidase [Mycena olivaceomarginata]|nr:heme peroxidase [Mycena olivaceomarginata]
MLDILESLRFDLDNGFIPGFVQPCNDFSFSLVPINGNLSGRSNAADWIRTAYHDMATHNIADGTGGLDASIRFAEERSRAENVGDGFVNTLGVLTFITNRYVSVADALALGTIIAVESCGGPKIAFRGGRIDATQPNAPGVPEPQQDISSHIASFARQGFTQDEMIGLVACGHTFGGVQHALFPDIVPDLNDTQNFDSVTHFDSTNSHFDNNVATEYISGTTQNPLVVGSNATTNSDARIFGSDGNATMRSFAESPELFASTCADLFTRMLDTVPAGVQLNEDLLTPLPVKPELQPLSLINGTLQFGGSVRFYNLTANPSRVVHVLWDDHLGAVHNLTLPPSQVTVSADGLFTRYTFAPTPANDSDGTVGFLPLDPSAGITRLRFAVDGRVEDQGGRGFAVQDALVFAADTSCLISNGPQMGRVDFALRTDTNVTRVYFEVEQRDDTGHVEIVEGPALSLVPDVNLNAPYALWTVNVTGGRHTVRRCGTLERDGGVGGGCSVPV